MTDNDGLPSSAPIPKAPKRRYTVSAKALAARRANLEKALAIPKEIRLRNTPAREQARRRNLEKAWAKQRDPQSIPGCRFKHGAYSRDLRRTAPLAGDQGDERLHCWLVRAAVVGGENVTVRFGAALEDAIGRLASETMVRLTSVRYDLSRAVEDCESQVADLESAQPESAQRDAAEHQRQHTAAEPQDPEDDDRDDENLEERSWPPEMRRWVAELDGKNAAAIGMQQVAEPWLDLDATRVAGDIVSWNANVQEAVLAVTMAVMQEPDPTSSAGQSGVASASL